MDALELRLKRQAESLGFGLCGIAAATEADGFARLREWLNRGYAGEMAYMHRHGDARRHPASVLPEARSVVMLGIEYPADRNTEARRPGIVAAYARGPDYHDVLRERLGNLLAWLRAEQPGSVGRVVVDTAPLLERDFARRAGLGWFGKNTMLINRDRGSFFFLGAMLTDLELQPDEPFVASHCGTCTACLDACPTGAFAGPGWLDARRCVSYLTIELKESIPEELRPGIGEMLFGCDICQDVCPWNRKAGTRPEANGPARLPRRPELASIDPRELLSLTPDQFRERFRGTAITRSKRRGLLRNAAIVLGNVGCEADLALLRRAMTDEEALVREAAAWAIARIEARGA